MERDRERERQRERERERQRQREILTFLLYLVRPQSIPTRNVLTRECPILVFMFNFSVQTFWYSCTPAAKFYCFIQMVARQAMVKQQRFDYFYAVLVTKFRTVHSFRCPFPCCFVVWLWAGVYPLRNIWKWTGRCMNL